jgi:hypothetical protein
VSPDPKDLQTVELLVEASRPGSAVIVTKMFVDEHGETKIEQTARLTEGLTASVFTEGDRIQEIKPT